MTIPAAAEGPKGTKIQRQETSKSAAASEKDSGGEPELVRLVSISGGEPDPNLAESRT